MSSSTPDAKRVCLGAATRTLCREIRELSNKTASAPAPATSTDVARIKILEIVVRRMKARPDMEDSFRINFELSQGATDVARHQYERHRSFIEQFMRACGGWECRECGSAYARFERMPDLHAGTMAAYDSASGEMYALAGEIRALSDFSRASSLDVALEVVLECMKRRVADQDTFTIHHERSSFPTDMSSHEFAKHRTTLIGLMALQGWTCTESNPAGIRTTFHRINAQAKALAQC